jgi:HAD superfamily hydrolase (TIGR01490 family)
VTDPRRHQLVPGVGEQAFVSGGLALFDLDRTIVPGSSLVHLGRVLVRRKMLSRRRLTAGLARNAAFRRRGAGDSTAARLRDGLLRHAAGLERDALLEVVQEVTPEIVADAYPAARWLLAEHAAAGDFCVIVSASPQELVESVVEALGAHRAVGTEAEVVDGRYTGELAAPFCHGVGKLARLRAEVGDVRGFRSAGYADSASDIPLLRACTRPVAVNPDRHLMALARSTGWPVLRFV